MTTDADTPEPELFGVDPRDEDVDGALAVVAITTRPDGIDASLAGTFSDSIGHVIDFMPTFCEVAGAEYPAEFQGRKPLPGRKFLRGSGGATPPQNHRYLLLFFERTPPPQRQDLQDPGRWETNGRRDRGF